MPYLIRYLAGLAFACMASLTLAQGYPQQPIRLVIPFTPGGVTDNIGRVLAERMSRELGQSIIVENRAGAAGLIGTNTVAKATADGYMLLLSSVGSLTILPHLEKMPFDPTKDLAPIMLVALNQYVIVVNPALGVRTVPELIAYAKQHPGKLSYGSSGTGGPTHLATELFKVRTGINMTHVPYKGDSAAVLDVLANHCDLSFSAVSATLQYIKAGQLIAIGTTGTQRSPQLPDVATVAETTVPGFSADGWVGLLAPGGTPPAVIKRIHDAAVIALADPDTRQKITSGGNTVVGGTPEEYAAFIRAESVKWGEVVKSAQITLGE